MNSIDYQEERLYVVTRLIILFIFALVSFLITAEMVPKIALVRLILGIMVLFSLLHNVFIARKPHMFISLRKNILILVDLLAVTLFILIFEQYGIYFFALYVLIVMQSSLYFGKNYAYTSLFSASVSWIVLDLYSSYWHEHYETIIAFAFTTFVTSLFALRFIRRTEEITVSPNTELTVQQTKVKHELLGTMPNKEFYRETIQNMIESKESFNLLFIRLDKFESIIDKHGFEIGEYVMEEAAKRLKNSLNEDDFLARLGDKEFVIINKQERSSLRRFLKNLDTGTMGVFNVKRVNVLIKINIGVSLFPENGQTVMLMSKSADDALRVAEESSNINHMFYGGIKDGKKQ